uniref:Uncharacterized protein n=1 Tax=Rhizophora mucronata TaxID=61149 RepID=A0A2P2R127_RHIMU
MLNKEANQQVCKIIV